METALVALISTALIILSSVIMMTSTLQSTSKMAASWQAMNREFDEIRSTQITAEAVDYYGGPIEIKLGNAGQSNLCDFTRWDVIAQYEDGPAVYLDYTGGTIPAANQWAIFSINVGLGQFEIFDPGILNPGEFLRMRISLDPGLELGQSVRFTIATPQGVKAQCQVECKPPP